MHLKYRPKTWDEVIGNDAIKKSLQNLSYSRPILLEGTRGCGKTTIAYLIAKDFGAVDLNIIDYNCGIDTGKSELEDKLDRLGKSTIFGDKQVLILDEIHLLSAAAKSTLLKPLESELLPSSSLIIACTTDPEKLNRPLYERFLQYRVKTLSTADSVRLLNKVIAGEHITISKQMISLIADKSEGIPRRLLTGLSKVKNIASIEEATYILDISAFEDDKDILDLFKVIINDNSKCLQYTKPVLKELLKTRSPDSIRIGLMNIIGGRVLSNFFNSSSEALKLIKLYTELQTGYGVPEKSNLILALLKGTV